MKKEHQVIIGMIIGLLLGLIFINFGFLRTIFVMITTAIGGVIAYYLSMFEFNATNLRDFMKRR